MHSLRLKHPIYIISKGRWENPQTANFLKEEGIPFTIAVEPQEYDQYCEAIGEEYIGKLPFSNLGLGSYPARNWCWENSIERGYDWHFLFDDNIRGFYKLNHGERINCNAMPALLTLQNLVERYENLDLAGYNYGYFAGKWTNKPFFINTHVYSGMLIKNSIPHRWRLKYNEDVDLNLQILHNRRCTLSLNAYLIKKTSTVVKMKGGNQDELYKNNDPKKKILKSRSLEMVWPKYVRVVKKYNRPHHQVSWGKFFKHPLKKAANYDEIIERQKKEAKLISEMEVLKYPKKRRNSGV